MVMKHGYEPPGYELLLSTKDMNHGYETWLCIELLARHLPKAGTNPITHMAQA
jgi:hypothetical protein